MIIKLVCEVDNCIVPATSYVDEGSVHKYFCPRHLAQWMAQGMEQRMDWNSIPQVQAVIKSWADQNFPQRTAYSALCKLMLEEIPEFALSQRDPGEYADLLILIFDIASLNGINIGEALRDKMELNMRREWDWDPTKGIAHHKGKTRGS